jgi:transcriptional regulator GlxA family with amidase domain
VFANLPGADVVLCAAEPGIITDDVGLVGLDVARALDDVGSPDVVVAPGGLVTRRMARDGDPVIDWIRRVHPETTFTTSVCTGTLLLTAAGLLRGDRATSHWIAYDALADAGVEATDERVVRSGKIFTAAGVSAGIDLALTVVGALAGADVARAIQLGIEYDPRPPFDSGSPSTAPRHVHALVTELLEAEQSEILDRTRS